MTEHNSSAHKTVRFVSGDFLKSGQVVLQNLLSTEFVNQFQVVDCFRNTICANFSRKIVRINGLFRGRYICGQCCCNGGFWVCHGALLIWRDLLFFCDRGNVGGVDCAKIV